MYLLSKLFTSRQALVKLGSDLGIIPKSKRLWAQNTNTSIKEKSKNGRIK